MPLSTLTGISAAKCAMRKRSPNFGSSGAGGIALLLGAEDRHPGNKPRCSRRALRTDTHQRRFGRISTWSLPSARESRRTGPSAHRIASRDNCIRRCHPQAARTKAAFRGAGRRRASRRACPARQARWRWEFQAAMRSASPRALPDCCASRDTKIQAGNSGRCLQPRLRFRQLVRNHSSSRRYRSTRETIKEGRKIMEQLSIATLLAA